MPRTVWPFLIVTTRAILLPIQEPFQFPFQGKLMQDSFELAALWQSMSMFFVIVTPQVIITAIGRGGSRWQFREFIPDGVEDVSSIFIKPGIISLVSQIPCPLFFFRDINVSWSRRTLIMRRVASFPTWWIILVSSYWWMIMPLILLIMLPLLGIMCLTYIIDDYTVLALSHHLRIRLHLTLN